MTSSAFVTVLQPLRVSFRPSNRATVKCELQKPRPPNDPTELRTESQKRRNSPPKPMRRRRRRTEDESPLDWDNMQSVPLVRPDATPESGDDYWIDFDPSVQLGDASGTEKAKKRKKKKIDPNLQRKLKEEVVSPYTQNWILRVGIAVFVLAVMWKLFGGDDATPIIRVPDL